MTQDEITNLSPEEEHRLFELYRQECSKQSVEPDLSDFMRWMEER